MESFSLIIPNSAVLSSNTVDIKQKADSLIITDNENYLQAGELLKTIKALQEEVNKTFDASIAAAHKAHQAAIAAKKPHIEALLQAETKVKLRISEWNSKIALERIEAERKQREAREQAQRDQEASERRAREEAQERQRQAEMAIEMAMEAELLGDKKTADDLLEEAAKIESIPMVIPKTAPTLLAPQPLPPPPPKIQGVSSRTVWKWRVTDASLIPRAYLILNEALLNALAKSRRELVPGIEFYSQQEISSTKGSKA